MLFPAPLLAFNFSRPRLRVSITSQLEFAIRNQGRISWRSGLPLRVWKRHIASRINHFFPPPIGEKSDLLNLNDEFHFRFELVQLVSPFWQLFCPSTGATSCLFAALCSHFEEGWQALCRRQAPLWKKAFFCSANNIYKGLRAELFNLSKIYTRQLIAASVSQWKDAEARLK